MGKFKIGSKNQPSVGDAEVREAKDSNGRTYFIVTNSKGEPLDSHRFDTRKEAEIWMEKYFPKQSEKPPVG